MYGLQCERLEFDILHVGRFCWLLVCRGGDWFGVLSVVVYFVLDRWKGRRVCKFRTHGSICTWE